MTDQKPEVEVSTDHASTNFYWTFGKQEVFNLQTTVRGVTTTNQIEAHLITVKNALTHVVAIGGHAKPVGRQPEAAGNGQPVAGTQPVPVATLSQAQDHFTEEMFEAEQLVANMSSGKTYWKVKGGKYGKFGVAVWPEVLDAAGLASDKLDPSQVYDLAGYKAFTVSSEGKPQKVTRLEK